MKQPEVGNHCRIIDFNYSGLAGDGTKTLSRRLLVAIGWLSAGRSMWDSLPAPGRQNYTIRGVGRLGVSRTYNPLLRYSELDIIRVGLSLNAGLLSAPIECATPCVLRTPADFCGLLRNPAVSSLRDVQGRSVARRAAAAAGLEP